MKTRDNSLRIVIILGFVIAMASCQRDEPMESKDLLTTKSSRGKTFYGLAVPLGNGVAQAGSPGMRMGCQPLWV